MWGATNYNRYNNDMSERTNSQVENSRPSSSSWYDDETDGEEEDLASLTPTTVRKRLLSQGSVDTLDTLTLTEESLHSHPDEEWNGGSWLKETKVHFSFSCTTVLEFNIPAKEHFSNLYYTSDELLDFREEFQSEQNATKDEESEGSATENEGSEGSSSSDDDGVIA